MNCLPAIIGITLSILLVFTTQVLAEEARGDTERAPDEGGFTQSLGMPPVYKGFAGIEAGWYRPTDNGAFEGYATFGLMRDLGSPIVGAAGLGLQGYGGIRAEDFDGGGRGYFLIPSFRLGLGLDYNIRDDALDFLFALGVPIRRGGIVGGGSNMVFRWLPGRGQTISLGIEMPLWGSNLGKTRPRQDYVRLDSRKPDRLPPSQAYSDLDPYLANLRERARWVALLTQPFGEEPGADAAKSMAPVLSRIQAHWDSTDSQFPSGHTLNNEISQYHQTLEQAFSLAAAASSIEKGEITELGTQISSVGRRILFESVLAPYNYNLGQRKKNDTLTGQVALGQTRFARWLLSDSLVVNREQVLRVVWVYQSLCDIMEENRAELKRRWKDNRFVWLPLQYAFKPEDHDTQNELIEIIETATQEKFSRGNRMWYIINEEFQWEFARSVQQAEDYHVLWIHDLRGNNARKKPDLIAYVQVVNYMETLTKRVQEYDETGTLPIYMIFLDQHYFEINKSRIWLRLLREPLDYKLDLPDGFEEWETRIETIQADLRQAVAQSQLLTLERSQFGGDWLKNRIKIHVNITNPADPSFVSHHIAGILPIPDNMMRDHRKIAFFDVSEEDPYRGAALFTGMGIGEHYVGSNWEDRAVMLQGPEALNVKEAAYQLMLNQGFEPEEIPFPLRPQLKAPDYDDKIEAYLAQFPEFLDHQARILQLHNQTGFKPKPINVAKAVLYSLMPVGSVLKVPDSLWQSYIYASLLAGSAMRGCNVIVIAPTASSAPSAAAPTLARAHGLLGRLIVFDDGMDTRMEEEGGILKVGLYAPRQGVGDLAGRFEQAARVRPEWLRRVYPSNPAAREALLDVRAQLDSIGYKITYLADQDSTDLPKLHLKANLFASKEAWEKLIIRPEWAGVMREYMNYLATQKMDPAERSGKIPDVRSYPEGMRDWIVELVTNYVADLTDEEKKAAMLFLTVGSVNMDNRSMVMDGEVMITMAGWQGLSAMIDFILLAGLCEWPETTEQFDELLAPPGWFTRSMAGLMKISL